LPISTVQDIFEEVVVWPDRTFIRCMIIDEIKNSEVHVWDNPITQISAK